MLQAKFGDDSLETQTQLTCTEWIGNILSAHCFNNISTFVLNSVGFPICAAGKYILSKAYSFISDHKFFDSVSSHSFGLVWDKLKTSSSISPRALSNSSS